MNKETKHNSHFSNPGQLELAQKLVLDLQSSYSKDSFTKHESDLVKGYYNLAKVFYDKSDLITAKEYFIEALKHSNKFENVFLVTKIYGFLLRIFSELQSLEDSKVYFSKLKTIVNENLENKVFTAESYYNQGMIYSYEGLYTEAKEFYKKAVEVSSTKNESDVYVKSVYALTQNYFHLGDLDMTLKSLNLLRDILNVLNKDYMRGSAEILSGNLKVKQRDYFGAIEDYNKALEFLKVKKCWNLYGYIFLHIGIVYKKLEKFNLSKVYLQNALNFIDESCFQRLSKLIHSEMEELNTDNVDIVLDKRNRVVYEKNLGKIDFRHRFVLLEILFLLAQNPGKFYNKEELVSNIWHDDYNPLIHDKLIYTSISRLRKLIEPKVKNLEYIIRGKDGYSFNQVVNARFSVINEDFNKSILQNIEISTPV